eukprot:c101_g2_i1.p1 GENE.c101_g2_i1~~c101_g2_i1.p1  ORF type:complete len:514 (-),score=124.77 c101_g2_i1:335-1687(-)
MKARVDRGNDRVELEIVVWGLEDADGNLKEAGYEQRMAQDTIQMRYVYGEKQIEITSISSGQTKKSSVPRPKQPALGQQHVIKLFKEACGSPKFTTHIVKPELGPNPVQMVRFSEGSQTFESLGADGDVAVYEQMQPLTKWTVSVENLPINFTETFSSTCDVMVKMTVDSQFGLMETTVTDQTTALGTLSGTGPLPELVYSTSVPLAKPITNIFQKSKLKLRIRTKSGEPFNLPSSGYQHVTVGDNGELTVLIDLSATPVVAPEEDLKDPAFLEASAMIDKDDPIISSIASAVVKASKCADRIACVRAIQQGAKRHFAVSNLATGFASATEAARTKKGDCTEHAVLLAALLRAQGYPARVCSGLVYTETQFARVNTDGSSSVKAALGWHMWSQALVNGAWIDLDATLPVHFHVGHVLASCTALSDSSAHLDSIKLVNLIGNLEIDVISSR